MPFTKINVQDEIEKEKQAPNLLRRHGMKVAMSTN